MRYSKTNTTWFISRSSKNSWFLGVGCVRLLPSTSRREVASRIQHRGTSNFFYFSQNHVVFVYNYIPTWIMMLNNDIFHNQEIKDKQNEASYFLLVMFICILQFPLSKWYSVSSPIDTIKNTTHLLT